LQEVPVITKAAFGRFFIGRLRMRPLFDMIASFPVVGGFVVA